MNNHLYALVMAGGGGTRLWPMSRRTHPKQMLKLFGERSMFQLAIDRLLPLLPLERVFVVTAEEQVDMLAAQYPQLPRENFIIEPMGRGTASCIGLSALHLHQRNPDAVMIVVTADHFILREDDFRNSLQAAQAVAQQGYLVTLGITPTFASTGYGYICRGARLGIAQEVPYYQVSRFTEKPDAVTAEGFLQAGTYVWNSGMFVWRTARILEEIQRWMPDLHITLQALADAWASGTYDQVLERRWPTLQKETIDYGIMEKASKVAVIPVDLGWSDIGAWASVMALHTPDAQGNVWSGDIVDVDTEKTMVLSSEERLIALIGVHDLIVIDTPDALLITRREDSQRVREVVGHLKAAGREDKL